MLNNNIFIFIYSLTTIIKKSEIIKKIKKLQHKITIYRETCSNIKRSIKSLKNHVI